MRRDLVEQAVARRRYERVPEDQPPQPVGDLLGDAGDDGAAEAVPQQDHVAQVGAGDVVDDRGDAVVVGDVLGHADAVPCDGRGVHVVAHAGEVGRDRLPQVAVVPGTVDEDVGAHALASVVAGCPATLFTECGPPCPANATRPHRAGPASL